ncbi:hypothetical protein [Paracidovorax citrulli]|nr:hypothetical protein [Paracidovorax citrulli]
MNDNVRHLLPSPLAPSTALGTLASSCRAVPANAPACLALRAGAGCA